MSGFFNILRFGKKINKGGKAIDKVAPTIGSSMKETFMTKYRNKESKKYLKQMIHLEIETKLLKKFLKNQKVNNVKKINRKILW